MDRFPPSCDAPEHQLHSIRRSLEDLAPPEMVAPRPGGLARPLAFAALTLAALMAFVGWLLVSAPAGP